MKKNILKIKKLSAGVEGKKILNNINLNINEGEFHVIMGTNGTGKSTLGNILTGKENYDINSGDIIYKNKSIIPTKDDVFECIIDSITRMGVIAYLDYKESEDSSIKESPLLFIVPKDFLPEGKIDQLKKNDTIKIKVLDTRIKFMAEQIQIVGEGIF